MHRRLAPSTFGRTACGQGTDRSPNSWRIVQSPLCLLRSPFIRYKTVSKGRPPRRAALAQGLLLIRNSYRQIFKKVARFLPCLCTKRTQVPILSSSAVVGGGSSANKDFCKVNHTRACYFIQKCPFALDPRQKHSGMTDILR